MFLILPFLSLLFYLFNFLFISWFNIISLVNYPTVLATNISDSTCLWLPLSPTPTASVLWLWLTLTPSLWLTVTGSHCLCPVTLTHMASESHCLWFYSLVPFVSSSIVSDSHPSDEKFYSIRWLPHSLKSLSNSL